MSQKSKLILHTNGLRGSQKENKKNHKDRIIYRHVIYKFTGCNRDCYSSQALLFFASVFVHLVMISAI